jgi:uncharacterized protein (DUF433 family)
MLDVKIVKTGRGPEIAGTRITVYDIIDYHKTGWHRDMIADTLELSSEQVDVALRYLEEHHEEVMAAYEKNMDRIRRGNPPGVQMKLDAAHERFVAIVSDRQTVVNQEIRDAGDSRGH